MRELWSYKGQLACKHGSFTIAVMATTLGAEKNGSDLTKQEEKMTNAPVRTAPSEPGDTSQHTTETKKVELNKQFIYLISVRKKAPHCISILS